MDTNLRKEIGQERPFGSLEQEAYLNMQRTANLLVQGVAEVLKPAGLTPTQYNVLRILRGAEEPRTCGEVGERMVTRDPDVTRILDRLESQGLIRRERSAEDRRVVVTEITAKGRDLVDELDGPVARLHAEQLGHMSGNDLRTLNSLLEEARARIR
jgi:DNA-binding MarR family transcriptional regulator